MKNQSNKKFRNRNNLSRRVFIKNTTASAAAGAAAFSTKTFAAGQKKVRVAMIGCGGRGTHDAIVCLNSAPAVELYAVADLFEDKVFSSLQRIRKGAPGKVNIKGRTFLGFDAYKKILAMDEIDLVMLLTPPGFRPEHIAAAVKAGKHVFAEKPGAVDPTGIRSLIKSAEEADKKNISIAVGTQQRYAPQYREIIQRIWDGQIGDLRVLKAYWICGMVNWHFAHRKPAWSDMEWQVRCWPFFTWLSGDHLVEQLCHNIDVCNWIIKNIPANCTGLGGRQVRTGPEYGNIYDHFSVDYRYAKGITMLAMAAQMANVTGNVGNIIEGTKGIAYVTRGSARIDGEKPWHFKKRTLSGETALHNTLINSIRTGKPINECRRLAEATLTAIAGRMSTYTGRALDFDWVLNKSQLDLRPKEYKLGPLPVNPVAMPGKTKLV